MSNLRNSLQNARNIKNDEYYTQKKDVIKILDQFESLCDERTIAAPFDSDESEFVKEMKIRGYNLKYSSDDYVNHLDEIQNEKRIVISNPPFSIFLKIVKDFEERGIRFLLIAPETKMYNINLKGNFGILSKTTFKNGKQVNCCLYSNFLKLEKKKIKKNDFICGYECYDDVRKFEFEKPTIALVPGTVRQYEIFDDYEMISSSDDFKKEFRESGKFGRLLLKKKEK